MAMFITIGYGDRDGYDRTEPTVRDAGHAQLHGGGGGYGHRGPTRTGARP